MDPRKALRAIAQIASALDGEWPQYEQVEGMLGASTIPGAGAGAHGGDTPDPVYGVALSHERYFGNAGQVFEVLELLRDVDRSVSGVRRQRPELAREVDAARSASRCSGEVDVTCVENAVKDGLCSPCYWKRYRANVKADEPMEAS